MEGAFTKDTLDPSKMLNIKEVTVMPAPNWPFPREKLDISVLWLLISVVS